MGEIFENFALTVQLFVLILTSYYLILSLFGFYKKRIKNKDDILPQKKFALVIAAHDEEAVIKQIIDSTNRLEYPKELYDTFVIADNCTDATAKIAKECGALVYERFNETKRGKGYALEWMFDKIFKMNKKYDAIAIFDADNLISKNFLSEMNSKLVQGYKVVQGYIDSKNPDDSWITQSYSIAFWTSNRLFQLSRYNLGLSCQIGGTGFCVDLETLKKLGWGATCLTEDLEFTCKLVLSGEKVTWCHDAIVYDEKPLTLKQSWNQRKRWMQGFADVTSRFLVKLLKKAIKDKSFIALDCALYTLQPYMLLLAGASTLVTFIADSLNDGTGLSIISTLFTPIVIKTFGIIQFMFTPIVMLLDKKIKKTLFICLGLYSLNVFLFDSIVDMRSGILLSSKYLLFLLAFLIPLFIVDRKKSYKTFIYYLLYGLYTLTWIPITIQGILNKNNKEWSHTKHTRQITIDSIH